MEFKADVGGLESRWDGLNSYLIATVAPCNRQGVRTPDTQSVRAPLTEANLEASLNWQSPFEASSPETRAPALLAMLQSGALQPMIQGVLGNFSASAAQEAQNRAASFIKQFEGRTGLTKLNSTQVFTGMQPIKIQGSFLFRAWSDPLNEVERPVNKLMEWALPAHIADESTVLSRAAGKAAGDENTSGIDVLLPSTVPTMVSLEFKGRTYAPLVIESISLPIGSPITRDGRFVELLVPISFGTLTALSAEDWRLLNYDFATDAEKPDIYAYSRRGV